MRSLKSFLKERTRLVGSGRRLEYEHKKYIMPNIENEDSDLYLSRACNGYEIGEQLVPLDESKDVKGKRHTKFRIMSDGKTEFFPHTAVAKPQSGQVGKYIDEHAVIKMANHAAQTYGSKFTIKHLHNDIELAEQDSKHPLNYSKSKATEFLGRMKNRKSKKHYYDQLRDAAHTIVALNKHEDFKQHFENKDTFHRSGRQVAKLTPHYEKEGVKWNGATSKADIIIKNDQKGLKMVSLKQGRSQLMSSSPAEFSAVYKHAINEMHRKSIITQIERNDSYNHIEQIKHLLKNHANEKISRKMLDELHEQHGDDLIREIHHEAITGAGKFLDPTGRASHIATIGEKAEVHKAEDYINKYVLKKPVISGSKHTKNNSTVRLESPTKKRLNTIAPGTMGSFYA